MLNTKAQMSAPFELMVAVIIMGFVILIGSNLLATLDRQICLNKVEKSMDDFVNLLEDTALNRGSNAFVFSTGGCFSDAKTSMKIEKRNTSRECSLLCGNQASSCYGLVFTAEKVPNSYIAKCINIPGYTVFMSDFTCNQLRDSLDYNWVNVQSNLPTGSYQIKNVSSTGDTYPKICIYRK